MRFSKLAQPVWLRVMGIVAIASLPLHGACADYTDRDDVLAYVDEIVEEHDFDRQQVLDVLREAKKQQSIIDAISRPAEKTWTWHEYRGLFLQDTRIGEGLAFWQENEALLEQAAEKYGVAPEVIVAILGVETRFGRIMGNYRVLDALMTLGFDYPPRAKFFRKELTEFLLLAREEGKSPDTLMGSYAGAMGYGQFIPSSFRHYAVDFDGDGQRDIWTNKADAVGSIANYFKRHGWSGEQTVVYDVENLPAAFVDQANDGLRPDIARGDLEAAGATLTARQPYGNSESAENAQTNEGIDPESKGALFRLTLEDGEAYVLGMHDFYVITRYNHSHMYALAVYELGQAIKAKKQAS